MHVRVMCTDDGYQVSTYGILHNTSSGAAVMFVGSGGSFFLPNEERPVSAVHDALNHAAGRTQT